MEQLGNNIIVKVKHLTQSELQRNAQSCLDRGENVITIKNPKLNDAIIDYQFQNIYDSQNEDNIFQEQIKPFIEDGLQKEVEKTIFTYGSSATGKSIIINKLLKESVELLLQRTQKIKFSGFHIYNDEIIDLVQTLNTKLTLNEINSQVQILGLGSQVIDCMDGFNSLFKNVQFNLKQMNQGKMSSNCGVSFIVYTLNDQFKFVDMPSKQRLVNASKQVEKECIFINKSLQSFEKVIALMSENQSHIPYRECKITRYFKETLQTNNWKGLFCISCNSDYYTDTTNILQFANQCKLLS